MAKSSETSGKVPEYDLTNPVIERVWFDPRKRYTRESYKAGWNHFLSLTKKNYSTLPLLGLSAGIVPLGLVLWFQYKLTHSPEMFSPNKQPHWDKWDNRHAKLNTPTPEGMKVLMSKHPRPHYEWTPEDKPSKVHFVGSGKKQNPKKMEPPKLNPHQVPRGL